MKTWLILLFLLPASLAAQGVISGRAANVVDASAGLPPGSLVAAIVLPDQAHPFCEMTAGTWQQAMDELAAGGKPQTSFGSLDRRIEPQAVHTVQPAADGSFRFGDMPLEARIGLAVRIEGLWWPLREEVWLTAQAPESSVEVPWFPLGGDAVLDSHALEVRPAVRQDLKYGGIAIRETLRLTNQDPSRGAMVECSFTLAVVPGIAGANLPALYGSQLLYMQGWNLSEPVARPRDIRARFAWTFGGSDAMHGGGAVYNKGAQSSADNWHPLQDKDWLAMAGAGDTLFEDAQPAPRLIFRRVIPPARDGKPGVLELRLMHQGGVLTSDPTRKIRLSRRFPMDLLAATAEVEKGLTLSALVEPGHRALYTPGEGTARRSAEPIALPADAAADFILGFDTEMQQQLATMEAAAVAAAAPQGNADDTSPQKGGLIVPNLFKALAALFGLAFLGALIASLRKPREQQLEALARLPQPRADLVAALRELDAEYKAGRLPAASYLDQRQRLVNRILEADLGGR